MFSKINKNSSFLFLRFKNYFQSIRIFTETIECRNKIRDFFKLNFSIRIFSETGERILYIQPIRFLNKSRNNIIRTDFTRN
jgi:hypothetical protein